MDNDKEKGGNLIDFWPNGTHSGSLAHSHDFLLVLATNQTHLLTMKFRLLLVVFVAGLQTLQAQNTLTPETLWQFGMISEAVPSPDGQKIAYAMRKNNLAENTGNTDLYLMDADSKNLKALTQTPKSESNIQFSADGQTLYYLSPESGESQVYALNLSSGVKAQVTQRQGGVNGFIVSPMGDKMVFAADVRLIPDLKQQYPDLPKATGQLYDALMHRHWNSWADGTFSHVFVQDLKNGKASGDALDLLLNEKFDSPLKPFGGMEDVAWSPDGKNIYYTCKKKFGTSSATSTNSDIYVINLAYGKTTNLTETNPGYDTHPTPSPDGKRVAWLSMARDGYEADKNRVMIYDFATDKSTEIAPEFEGQPSAITWSATGDMLYVKADIQGTVQLFSYSFRPTKEIKRLVPITQGNHNYTSLAFGNKAGNPYLLAMRMSMNGPNEIYTVNLAQGTATQVSQVNTTLLGNLKMGKVESRKVKATDGKEIFTWVIYPPDFDPAKKYPTLLYCQGGPQSMVGQFFSVRWNFQLMAAKGYIVVAPNRRGLPGFGQAWNEQISGDWGGQAMKDLLSAIDDVAREPYVNKEKLGAVGASFGGYSVYWLAGNHNKRFKAFISHCGVFNLESMYGATEEIFFSDFEMGGPYWKQPKPVSYDAFSPHKFVQNWDTPMLVIHNDKDFRVPIGEGLQAFSAAQLKGVPSQFLFFPDEGHWVLKPQNNVLWNRVFFNWLDKWLK